MVFNATYNNISVILRRSVLLMEEATHKLLSHNVISSTPRMSRIRTNNVSDDRH